MSRNKSIDSAVAEVGVATRAGDPDRVARARQRLAAVRVEREIDAALHGDFPITDEDRDRLSLLLSGGAR